MLYHILVTPKSMAQVEVEIDDAWLIPRISRTPITEVADGDPLKGRVYYTIDTQEESYVTLLAGRIAQHNPGHEVYVLQAVKVFATTLPPIVEKSVSNQGVLPV